MKSVRASLTALLVGVAAIVLSLATAITFGKGLYNATHQTVPTGTRLTTLEGKITTNQTWIGSCGGQSWWIIPFASGSGTVSILEGNPNFGLENRTFGVKDLFRSNCVFIEPVFIKDGEYFVFKVWSQ